MKPFRQLIIFTFVRGCSFAFAADESPFAVNQPTPEITTARILGNLQDGTPPPPEPPKPKFIVPAKDILESKTHQQGGREITIQRIKPIALPPRPQAPAPIDLDDPALQERIAARRAKYPAWKLLLVGATVYHSEDAPPRTLVRLWPQAQGEPLTVWSSADFSLLSGLPNFTISSGETTSLMMSWSITDLDHANMLQRKFARQLAPLDIPALPDGNATFIITEGNPTEEALVSIRSLHEIYNSEYDRLLAAYQGRERAQRLREAELKSHPPKPKNLTLNYWLTDSADQAAAPKGGAR